MTIEQKLRAIAQELREHPEHWGQGENAKTASGDLTLAHLPDAACWCSIGLLLRDMRWLFDQQDHAEKLLEAAIGEFPEHPNLHKIAAWNDAPGRTVCEIADAFDRAADLAAAELAKAAQ
jgi:hypothetical protein